MRFALWLLCSELTLLSGCAAMPQSCNVRGLPADLEQEIVGTMERVTSLESSDTVVFGRIVFIRNGKSELPYGFNAPRLIVRQSLSTSPGKAPCLTDTLGSIRMDGLFVYVLPAGRYEIGAVSFDSNMVLPAVAFDAHEPGSAYYLGDLVIDYEASKVDPQQPHEWRHLNKLEVVDHYDEVRTKASTQLSQLKKSPPVRKALMIRVWDRAPKFQ